MTDLRARNESDRHRYTKESVVRMVIDAGDKLRVNLWDGYRSNPWSVDLTGLEPVIECCYPLGIQVMDPAAYYVEHGCYPQMIFDVGLRDRQSKKVVGAIEIVKTNPVSRQKAGKILDAGLFAVVVDAFEIDRSGLYIDTRRVDATQLILSRGGRSRVRAMTLGESFAMGRN